MAISFLLILDSTHEDIPFNILTRMDKIVESHLGAQDAILCPNRKLFGRAAPSALSSLGLMHHLCHFHIHSFYVVGSSIDGSFAATLEDLIATDVRVFVIAKYCTHTALAEAAKIDGVEIIYAGTNSKAA